MIIDAHCDVLWKLWEKKVDFYNSEELRFNYLKWQQSDIKVQCFAIFVPEEVKEESQFSVALEMVSIFFEQVVDPYDDVKFISNRQDLLNLKAHEKGAVLTLEGCHSIGADINKLKALVRMGVRIVGLTWNQANAVCDGIEEERGAGLSSFGKDVVHYLNKEQIWVDLSHISYQGFWDIMDIGDYPMASHSNVFQIAPHVRNLDNSQIEALIACDSWIGITFVPEFINGRKVAYRQEIIKHIEYIVAMGGESILGFGSDFEGTEDEVIGLKDIMDYKFLINDLCHSQTKSTMQKLSYKNFVDKFPRIRN
ncbi:diguanylate cyclase [Thalassobacillus devorans]|uniref:Diguanylate cyclase n=1 Tax=Thalassobacillus devorans TaxID=279813 RepID=A0ABQ1P2L1_9BACI|nr:membrane dipeptidase [Thalassobacillus devorans]NIK27985.1 membrane dipeptidase [Thalassobacillus devorans]GGC89856.1 diguanylate cyclase [Thalassobacillus devorans]